MSKLDEKLFDTRVVHHRLRRGALTKEQHQQYLETLPDDAAESAPTTARFVTPYAERNYDA